MEKISYFIKEGCKNIWANRIMSLASIGTLIVCLILLGSSLLVSININNLIKEIESQNQIMAFLQDDISATTVTEIGDQINALPNVAECVFVSKQEALDQQKQSLGKYSGLLEGFQKDNPFPNAYRVKLKSMSGYAETVRQIGLITGVKDITQHVELAYKLISIRKVISMIGIWLFILLVVVSLFIIANTIKIAMYVRKREINIMKFVGATDWFIRWPFIVEGLIIGLISSLIAFLIQWYIYSAMISKIVNVLGIIKPLYFNEISAYIAMGFAVTGILVGVFGSLISVRKYLRV